MDRRRARAMKEDMTYKTARVSASARLALRIRPRDHFNRFITSLAALALVAASPLDINLVVHSRSVPNDCLNKHVNVLES